MNRILVKSLLLIALVFSFSHAANAKTIGGFKPGDTFTLKVVKRTSHWFAGIESNSNARVPKGIPDYKLGQTVKFKIGAKGQLTAPKGLYLPYDFDIGYATSYSSTGANSVYLGQVFKKFSNHKPIRVVLVFDKYRTRGGITAGNSVIYRLE